MPPPPLLEIDGLKVEFQVRQGVVSVINDLHISLNHGETLGIVGESGCGKSITALAVMGLVPSPPGRVAAGRILLEGRNLIKLEEKELRRVRGNDISMIFQEPMTSLNPVFKVGEQIAETIRIHQGLSDSDAMKRAVEMLVAVDIPDPGRRVHEYPFQLSGGMRQRVMIAMALSCNPKVLIADEPTTALDVTVQAQIFKLLKEIQDRMGTAIIFITHDMGVIAEMADRVAVMYAGRKVEEGPVAKILGSPKHPYTRGLISCVPHLEAVPAANRPPLCEIEGVVPSLLLRAQGCPFEPRCSLSLAKCKMEVPPDIEDENGHTTSCWLMAPSGVSPQAYGDIRPPDVAVVAKNTADYSEDDPEYLVRIENLQIYFQRRRRRLFSAKSIVKAVDGISLKIRRGTTFGLVGESGSGKTTTAMGLMRLVPITAGSIFIGDDEVSGLQGEDLRLMRRRVQLIFQDPYSSLNPHQRAGAIVREPMDLLDVDEKARRDERVAELFTSVGLRPEQSAYFPHQFSGGQRQRIGVARALASRPDLVVCDEPVSALDVAIQAQILNMLRRLQVDFDLTYLFISHDLGVVQYVCDEIAVMYVGKIMEQADRITLFSNPLHPYTWSLLSAVPSAKPGKGRLGSRIQLHGDPPSPIDPPSGCRFASRCPFAGSPSEPCWHEMPELREIRPGQLVACHRVTAEGKAPHHEIESL